MFQDCIESEAVPAVSSRERGIPVSYTSL